MIRLRTEGPLTARFAAAAAALCLILTADTATGATGISRGKPRLTPRIVKPTAFDVSPALRDLAPLTPLRKAPDEELIEIRAERGEVPKDRGYARDGALQRNAGFSAQGQAIPGTSLTFEGLSNQDNFNIFGGRVNPPDSMGAVGPNHYVEMINLIYGIYDKSGNLLARAGRQRHALGRLRHRRLHRPSGDPVVLYDQLENRWLLSQFTTRGLFRRSVSSLLQLRGDLGDGRSHRRLLPLCVQDQPAEA